MHRSPLPTILSTLAAVLIGGGAALAAQDAPVPSAAPDDTAAIAMVAVAGGGFDMGSRREQLERPVHPVSLSPFAMSSREISRAQYKAVMGSLPPGNDGSDELPVENLSWFDAIRFCNALSAKEGLEPVYAVKGKTVGADLSKNGYRLPTEAEWEYAARGGPAREDFAYAGGDAARDLAWSRENSGEAPHAGGLKAANSLGLYDMSGNVAEWCWDYVGMYPSKAQADPTGPAKGNFRVVRGGSYQMNENSGRVSFRTARDPKSGYADVGLRLVKR